MYNTHTKSTQKNENIQYTYKKSQNKNIQYSYKNRQNKIMSRTHTKTD